MFIDPLQFVTCANLLGLSAVALTIGKMQRQKAFSFNSIPVNMQAAFWILEFDQTPQGVRTWSGGRRRQYPNIRII